MLSYLKNCFAFSDDVSAGLCEKFELNVKQCHDAILAALKSKDRASLKSELHAMKGVLLNGGLAEEGDLTGVIESRLGGDAEVPWETLGGEVHALFRRLMESVETADRKRALIIDDMAFVREFVKRSLAKLFPTLMTVEAGTGQDALDLLKAEEFDLIICDWELPGINGVEILKQVRATQRTKNIPFMMLTANGDREHVMQAMQLGATDYLVKPVKLETLATKVRKLVSSS
jgi:CheY-like chemotaxis protein